jgi:hypothetical protein
MKSDSGPMPGKPRIKKANRDSQSLQQWKNENPGYPSKQIVRGNRSKTIKQIVRGTIRKPKTPRSPVRRR